jgi:beta-aspartyl-dipeptidase (metallo-type)
MHYLIENIETYDPQPLGRISVLSIGSRIAKLGAIDRRGLDLLGLEYEVIDGRNRLLLPGFIDVHEHLLGGSGEGGFGTQTPPIFLDEIVRGGITTVVGTLGVDSTTTTMQALVAKAKALADQGLTAWCYVGGYSVPPATVTGVLRDDLLLVAEIIGAGEIAISDHRCTDPSARELARVVDDAHVAGLLSGKAGITHFHVGDKPKRLSLLREILDEFNVDPGSLYPTHIERTPELFEEALELVARGVNVDIDVVEKDLHKWLRRYFDSGANRNRLTVSSDSFLTSPGNLYNQLRDCVVRQQFALEEVLPLVTTNPARILKFPTKGKVKVDADADLVLVEKGTLEITDVFALGRPMIRDGQLQARERFLEKSDRHIRLEGKLH